MNKSLEAFLRGYIVFSVNRKRFWLYNSALAYRKSITEGLVIFIGFSIVRGWTTFYARVINPDMMEVPRYVP